MTQIHQNPKKLFNYSYKERIFILILLCVLFATFTLPNMLYLLENEEDIESNEMLKYANKIDSFINSAHQSKTTTFKKEKIKQVPIKTNKISSPTPAPKRFNFNPMTISNDSLKILGISQKTAQNFTKFRKHGFVYKQIDDFKKIYGITVSEIDILKKYAKFPSNPDIEEKVEKKRAPKSFKSDNKSESKTPNIVNASDEKIYIEINTATEDEWQKLHGIGPYYAMRICKFRDQLGGFIKINQVADTYNLPDSVFQKIESQLILNKGVKKLALLESDKNILVNHPYISYKQAAIIEKYIAHRKDSFNLEMLYKIQAFDSSYINKIMPYLEL